MCIALASNKQYISFYAGPIGLEPYAERLPKANLGRGCIRFKRVDDIDLAVLDEVIGASAASDGRRVVGGRRHLARPASDRWSVSERTRSTRAARRSRPASSPVASSGVVMATTVPSTGSRRYSRASPTDR